MSSGTFVAKRFLLGMNDDYVNADHIVRLYWSTGKLMADMVVGQPIHLRTDATTEGPELLPAPQAVKMVSL